MITGRVRLSAVANAIIIGAGIAAVAAGTAASAGRGNANRPVTLHGKLSGYQETPLAVSSSGTATVHVRVNSQKQQISYTLRYTALESPFTQAHLHVGAVGQSGGIGAFLCSNLGNGPAGTPACPAGPASISGVIAPANVIGPVAQGIAAGEFAELADAVRAGAAYVNMHSTQHPTGEIRAQLGQHD